MYAKTFGETTCGINGEEIIVEVDISNGLPAFELVGLPDTAVRESRERVRAALKNSGYKFPTTRITVNLAPADFKKDGSGLDLPIAIGILCGSGQITAEAISDKVFVGELALDGSIREVSGILPMIIKAKETGRKFTLNGNVYTLKYVFENKIVIEKEKEDRETEINIINFSSDNKKILVPKTLDDTLTEKEKKEFWEISAVKKGSYYKKIFDFFSENPNSSLEEFKSNFPIEKLLKEKETYFIISITSPIENDFILYSPIYGFQKEFSLDL